MAKDTVFQLRLSQQQKQDYIKRAQECGLSLASWFLMLANADVAIKISTPILQTYDPAGAVREKIRKKERKIGDKEQASKKPFVSRLKGQWKP
jgi:hypothetical protein